MNAAETRAISHARVKSDRFDAAMLAKLLSAGMLKAVWVPDEATSALRRRVARRAGLVRARTRVKNEVHAVLARCLIGRPPVSDLFGKKGRVWLLEQQLPEEEAETVKSCLRHIDFLGGEITGLDQRIAQQALAFPGFQRLLTIPGVDVGTAAAVIAAIGDITRFQSPGQLVAYLGPGPEGSPVRVRASALWAHLKARRPAGPLDAGRGRVDLDPQSLPTQGIRRARPCPSRRSDCRGRCRAQARRALLAPPHKGSGLRVRAPITDAPKDAPPGTTRRRPTTDRQTDRQTICTAPRALCHHSPAPTRLPDLRTHKKSRRSP